MRFAIAIALLLVFAPAAEARQHLTKRAAHAQALQFASPFVDLLDVQRTIRPIMEAPRDCRRLGHLKVRCQFKAYMHDGREVQSWVTVRRQRDGLLGFTLPLDVLAEGI